MPSSQFSKFAATVALLILLSTIAAAQFQIGSSNTAFADPPVQLLHGYGEPESVERAELFCLGLKRVLL